jgi:hypothetical protein
MREIVTLQFGEQSNYLGTHFWNTQVSALPHSHARFSFPWISVYLTTVRCRNACPKLAAVVGWPRTLGSVIVCLPQLTSPHLGVFLS